MTLRVRIILLLFWLSDWPAASQTTGRLAGTVRDQTGGVIAGAQLFVASKSSGGERKVITDQTGGYAVPLLPPGVYRVTIRANGFQEAIFEDVNVTITETTFVNPDLALAAVAGASVTVSATVS